VSSNLAGGSNLSNTKRSLLHSCHLSEVDGQGERKLSRNQYVYEG